MTVKLNKTCVQAPLGFCHSTEICCAVYLHLHFISALSLPGGILSHPDITRSVRRYLSNSVNFSGSNMYIYPASAHRGSYVTGIANEASSPPPAPALQFGPRNPDWLEVESSRYADACRRKLPSGIHREDFARPLYRSDIFYSGSIVQIPEYKYVVLIVAVNGRVILVRCTYLKTN